MWSLAVDRSVSWNGTDLRWTGIRTAIMSGAGSESGEWRVEDNGKGGVSVRRRRRRGVYCKEDKK